MKQVFVKETRNEQFNDEALNYVFGSVVVPEEFTNMAIDEYSMFFMKLDLASYNINGLPDKGNIYVFFDVQKFYKGEKGPDTLIPYIYYSTKELELVLDDYNDAFKNILAESITQYEINQCYKKDAKCQLGGIPSTYLEEQWLEKKQQALIVIHKKSPLIRFFEHFVAEPNQVIISIDSDLELVESEWLKANIIIKQQ